MVLKVGTVPPSSSSSNNRAKAADVHPVLSVCQALHPVLSLH